MKKDYNRATMSDMPMDDSLNPLVVKNSQSSKTTSKPKINAIGKKATTATTKRKTTTTKQSPQEEKKTTTKLTSLTMIIFQH